MQPDAVFHRRLGEGSQARVPVLASLPWSRRKLATRKQGSALGSRRDRPREQQSALVWKPRMARRAHEREMKGQKVENLCTKCSENRSESSVAQKRAGPPASRGGAEGWVQLELGGAQGETLGGKSYCPFNHRHLLPKVEKQSTVPPWSLGCRVGGGR